MVSLKLQDIAREPWPPIDEDPMTGLPNFFGLLSEFPRIIAETSGVALILDIRNLESFNGKYGMSAGDGLIVSFSRLVQDALAHVDLRDARVYRVGGDEFCVVIPHREAPPEGFLRCLARGVPGSPETIYPAFPQSTSVFVRYVQGESDVADILVELWSRVREKKTSRREGRRDLTRTIAKSLVRRILETMDLLRATHRLAYTDDISGLPNHRAARYVINQGLEKCSKSGESLSLLFVDGDNLRQYNDTVGYDSGNEMIRRLGALLSSETSPGDLVARWLSGDEFMIVLANCGKKEAVRKAREICKIVQDESEKWIYPVTVSIGVASYPDDAKDADTLIKRVEEANLWAKKSGKNKACVWQDTLTR